MTPIDPNEPLGNKFLKLSAGDCKYLLELIDTMDSDTSFTKVQRSYTVPKLQKILKDPDSKRLAFQDIEYLLELLEDDELESSRSQRDQTRTVLEAIRALQEQKFQQIQDIGQQREERRLRRLEQDSQK
jgi:hypothetical protein